MTYNPDCIEQAKKDMVEQARLDVPYQSELESARAVAILAERADVRLLDPFTRESTLGHGEKILLKDNALYFLKKYSVSFCPLEDREVYLNEYAPFPNQEDALPTYLLAQLLKKYDPKDPLKYKMEKWIENIDEDVTIPNDAELIHTFFRNGDELYKKNDDFWIKWTYMGSYVYNPIRLSYDSENEQVYSLHFAVQCAIDGDIEYKKSKLAEVKLKNLYGLALREGN